LVGGVDGRVARWRFLDEQRAQTQLEKDKCFEVYSAHQTVLSAVAAHPFERVFFSGDWAGSLYSWLPYNLNDDFGGKYDKTPFTGRFYAAPGTFTKAERAVDRGITEIAVSENGNRLALATENGFLEVWEVRGLEMFARREAHVGRAVSVSLSPSGQRLASIGKDGLVKVFQLEEDELFGIGVDARRMKLVEVGRYEVPSGNLLRFITERSVIVATSTGKLVEIDTNDTGAVPPTPTPTPTASPDRITDTDY
jgi:WD40 repeat protein